MFLETLFLLLKWYKERSSRTQSCSFPSLRSEDSGKENNTEATNEFCTSEHFQPPAQKACSDCSTLHWVPASQLRQLSLHNVHIYCYTQLSSDLANVDQRYNFFFFLFEPKKCERKSVLMS